MADHIKAACVLEACAVLVCDAVAHLAPDDVERISRLRFITRQLGHEAEELRLSTLTVIEGGKGHE